MKKSTVIAAVLAFSVGGLISAFAVWAPSLPARNQPASGQPIWTEVKWPFPMDEWGEGKAFRCGAEVCGTEVNLYIRAKIGFCNCTTGVSDDEELDRLSDYRLMGDRPSVLGPGHPIDVAWMKGRSRPYVLAAPAKTGQSALALAFNDHCDALVATAVIARDAPVTVEPIVVEFLNSQTIIRWTRMTLNL
jgi:hypothetical protein